MAGRPVTPNDFLGEEEIEVLRRKLRELYDLFIEESNVDEWREEKDFRTRESMKRNANQSLLMMKPLTVIVDNLCKQYGGHDEEEAENRAMIEDIKKLEAKSGKK